MKLALAFVTAFVLSAPAAAASPSLAYSTPAAMAARIHGATPQIRGNNYSAPSTITATTCRGLGAAHRGLYNTFRCSATWNGGKATVWARALPGKRFCASAASLASCPPGPPDAGDPRICSDPPPLDADPDRCALAGAELSLIRGMKVMFGDPTWTIRNLSCDGSNLTWTCQFSSSKVFGTYYRSVVSFADAAASWSASIATTTVNQAGAAVVCRVAPLATAPGAASRWDTGPVPACAS
jgi:hypothetical protein